MTIFQRFPHYAQTNGLLYFEPEKTLPGCVGGKSVGNLICNLSCLVPMGGRWLLYKMDGFHCHINYHMISSRSLLLPPWRERDHINTHFSSSFRKPNCSETSEVHLSWNWIFQEPQCDKPEEHQVFRSCRGIHVFLRVCVPSRICVISIQIPQPNWMPFPSHSIVP